MIKLFLLIIFFFTGTVALKAEEILGSDQDFMKELDNVKSPFEDGTPKEVHLPQSVQREQPRSVVEQPKAPQPVAPPEVITLPALDLQGVIVGENVHQAIINGQVVPLHGSIQGARIDSMSKDGVGLFFKGKKFFLKID